VRDAKAQSISVGLKLFYPQDLLESEKKKSKEELCTCLEIMIGRWTI